MPHLRNAGLALVILALGVCSGAVFKDGAPTVAKEAAKLLDGLLAEANAEMERLAELATSDPKAASRGYIKLLNNYGELSDLKKRIKVARAALEPKKASRG